MAVECPDYTTYMAVHHTSVTTQVQRQISLQNLPGDTVFGDCELGHDGNRWGRGEGAEVAGQYPHKKVKTSASRSYLKRIMEGVLRVH